MPLTNENTEALLADTLRIEKSNINELATLIHTKTGGNPFFTNEFLKSLYSDEYITFDPEYNSKNGYNPWKWDLEKIKSLNISDNVDDCKDSKTFCPSSVFS